jgi:hypothetical protein
LRPSQRIWPERLHLGPDDRVLAAETERGILLSPYDPTVEKRLALAAKTAKKYRNALRQLAKSRWPNRTGWRDEPQTDMPPLAAAHLVAFLELNGVRFQADEAEVVTAMLAVAAGEMTQEDMATLAR